MSMAEEKKKKGGNTVEIVRELAEPVAQKLGLSLWDVNFVKEGAEWFLRLFIDKPEGISIDNCVDMTHEINPILDKEDPISHEYTLEVCSPGINRKLTRKEHFEAFLEAPVKVKLIRPMENGTREIEGILIDVSDNGDFEVVVDEDTTVSFAKKECSSVTLLDDDI
jgi:ribosome maturation factor RimP